MVNYILLHFLLKILLANICKETIFHSLAVSLLACFFTPSVLTKSLVQVR